MSIPEAGPLGAGRQARSGQAGRPARGRPTGPLGAGSLARSGQAGFPARGRQGGSLGTGPLARSGQARWPARGRQSGPLGAGSLAHSGQTGWLVVEILKFCLLVFFICTITSIVNHTRLSVVLSFVKSNCFVNICIVCMYSVL